MKVPKKLNLIVVIAVMVVHDVGAFATFSSLSAFNTRTACNHYSYYGASSSSCLHSTQNTNNKVDTTTTEEWISLTDDDSVKMRTILSVAAADGDDNTTPIPGKDDVTVEYIGSIAPRNWSTNDVISTWLPDRGLDDFANTLFEEFNINGTKLCNPKKFNAQFIKSGLGITNESKINKLLEAVDDLSKYDKSHPVGTVFDKNTFTFRLGKGLAIKAFDISLERMKVGETVTLVARADYAYGSKGLKEVGKVIVPPYSTVSFDLTLVEIK